MSRYKLELPDDLPFVTELDIRIGDINYGRHLANDAVLTLVHEVRMRFLKSFGFTEENIDGAALTMASAEIVYASQGVWGDRLKAIAGVGDLSRSGFGFYTCLVRLSDNKEIARVRTGMVCFDYERGRVIRLPESFRAAVGA